MPRKRRQGHKPAKTSPKPEETETPAPPESPSETPMVSFKEMADSILSVASSASSPVQVFRKLSDLMKNVMCVQRTHSLVAKASDDPEVRLTACNNLLTWMTSHSVDCSGVAVADFMSKGLGLRAERHFKKHELILRIPRDVMMTSQDAMQSEIGDFLMMDPVCVAMPPMALALFLLHERFKGQDSRWAPYIESLPQTYCGCLYISLAEFEMLKGSPTQEKVALDFRRMCRQYAIFTLELERCKEAEKVLFRNQFTWEDFRWALTAVLSRNNPIPKDEQSSSIGLVPVWDMGNFEFGEMTTEYDLNSDSLVFFAMRDFAQKEQIVFHYGNRPNCDLFMYAGFAIENNPYDRYPLKLGISANDTLHEKRSQFLKKFSLHNPDFFYLSRDENILTKEVVAFARIFVMKEDDLDQIDQWTSAELFQPLLSSSAENMARIDEEAVSFLQRRFQLLLSALKLPREAPSSDGAVEILKLLDGQMSILVDAHAALKS